MRNVLAIILAGGNGMRMGSLTGHRSKPILPFGAGYRVIDFSLTNCLLSGIRDIYALVDYQRQSTSEYLFEWSLSNSIQNTLKILEPKHGHYLGTADAVRQNLSHIKQSGADFVAVLAADHIYKMNFRDMLDFHIEKRADVTLAIKKVPIEEACLFGIVNINDDYEIKSFTEKPDIPGSDLASMGIYIFNTNILIEHLENAVNHPLTSLDFGHDVIPAMIKHKRVMAHENKGYWRDIGTIDSYFAAHMDMLSYPSFVSIEDIQSVLTGSTGLPPEYVNNGQNIFNSIINPACRIEGIVQNSIIDRDVYIKHQSVIKNSIILSDTVIGEYSIVEHSILDQNVKVDPFCYIGKPSRYGSRFSITVIEKGSQLSPYDALLQTCRNLFQTNMETRVSRLAVK